MNKKIFFKLSYFFFLSISLFSSCNTPKEKKCILKGAVINRNSDTIYLQKAFSAPEGEKIIIPIKNNRFNYEMKYQLLEAYKLIFKDEIDRGLWRDVIFFPDSSVVEFKLYSMDMFDKNSISGPLNTEFKNFAELRYSIFWPKTEMLMNKIEKLKDSGRYNSAEMDSLIEEKKFAIFGDSARIIEEKIQKLINEGKDKSTEATILEDKLNNMDAEVENWELQKLSENPDIVHYYILADLCMIKLDSKSNNKFPYKTMQVFFQKYPNHPYTGMLYNISEGIKKIKTGNKIIDFTAPDIQGNNYSILSTIKNNKVTYLDFWASWCGPYIKKSKQMIKVYNKYKDKGFNVIGIAREYGKTDKVKNTIQKNEFPWLNLVELNDTNKIWQKYGMPNEVGKTFLINDEGTILKINPSIDEVKEYLEKVLNNK